MSDLREGDTVRTSRGHGVVLKRRGSSLRVQHESGSTNWIELREISDLEAREKTNGVSTRAPSCNGVVKADAAPKEEVRGQSDVLATEARAGAAEPPIRSTPPSRGKRRSAAECDGTKLPWSAFFHESERRALNPSDSALGDDEVGSGYIETMRRMAVDLAKYWGRPLPPLDAEEEVERCWQEEQAALAMRVRRLLRVAHDAHEEEARARAGGRHRGEWTFCCSPQLGWAGEMWTCCRSTQRDSQICELTFEGHVEALRAEMEQCRLTRKRCAGCGEEMADELTEAGEWEADSANHCEKCERRRPLAV